MLVKYEDNLALRYGKAQSQILLGLKVAAMINTLLRKQNIRAYAPIGIVVETDAQADMLEEDLRVFRRTPRLSLTDKTETFMKKLECSKDDICFVRYRSGGKAEYLLDILHAYTQTGCGSDGKSIGTAVVCFVGFVPTVAKRFVDVIITVAEGENESLFDDGRQHLISGFQSLLIDFILKNYPLVVREIKKNFADYKRDNVPSCQFLRAAGMVYSLLLEANGREDWWEWRSKYEEQVEMIEAQSVDFHTGIDLISALRKSLYKTVNAGMRVVYRDELSSNDIQQVDSVLIYDECFYYIADSEFTKICKNFQSNLTAHQMKVELSETGTIQGTGGDDGKRGYYTVKLPLYSVYGDKMTPRMIRLRRNKIDIAGEEELWQISREEGGSEAYGALSGRFIEERQ